MDHDRLVILTMKPSKNNNLNHLFHLEPSQPLVEGGEKEKKVPTLIVDQEF